jgi:hypothetical protein
MAQLAIEDQSCRKADTGLVFWVQQTTDYSLWPLLLLFVQGGASYSRVSRQKLEQFLRPWTWHRCLFRQ